MRKRPIIKIILLLLICFAICLGIWAFAIEPNKLVVKDVTINLPRLPAEFDGLKIVAIGDLHVGSPFINEEKLKKIVAEINGLQPDLVLLLGDYVVQGVVGGHFVEPEIIAGELKPLRARLGVFAVLGNHDWWLDGERVRRAFESEGIRVLENEAVKVDRNGQSLWLVGLGDFWTSHQDIKEALKNIPEDANIFALTHDPDIFPEIPSRISLTFAAHTHGGQVNLPLVGRLIVPSEFKQRYAIGLVQESGHQLFVTPGIGTSILPVRFRVPPEISVLTIRTKVSGE
ncbi:MAG: metallophosphoesterase [Pyrinomonadaceae bacterium]